MEALDEGPQREQGTETTIALGTHTQTGEEIHTPCNSHTFLSAQCIASMLDECRLCGREEQIGRRGRGG